MDTNGKKRSNQQSKALHFYFQQIANLLNEHGVDLKALLEAFREEDTPITGNNIKDIFKSILFRMHGKNTTTEMTTQDLNEIFMVFNKNISLLTDTNVEFPSRESLELIRYYNDTLSS
jgi:hypothetical protein